MIMSTVNILSYAEIPSTDEDIPRELSVGQLLERANRNYSKLITCFRTYLHIFVAAALVVQKWGC